MFRFVLALIVVVTLLRLLVAGAAGLGDAEAYYWTWSTQLAPGYYDHGPAVALMIRLGTSLLGHSPLGVRLLFVLASGGILLLAALLARRIQGSEDSASLWAVLGLLSIPAFLVAGAAANPDVPLMLLVLSFLWIVTVKRITPTRCLLAGLVAGLAVCAKLFGLALVVPLLLVTWRVGAPRTRPLCVGVSLLGMLVGALPVLIWNVQNGWASLSYHLVQRHTDAVGPSLMNLAKLVGGQLAYVSPPMLLGLVAAALFLWRRRTDEPHRVLLSTAVALVVPGYLLILVVPGAEPHWPTAGYLALLPVLAVRLPVWRQARGWVTALAVIHLAVALLVGVALHIHVLTDLGVRLLPRSWYQPRYDLSNELRGWDRVADAVHQRLQAAGTNLAVGCHYTSCAQLAFAARGRFEVRCPSPRLDQFDFFPGGDGTSRRNVDLIYVRDDRFPFEAHALYRCRKIQSLQSVYLWRAGRKARRFELQWCGGFEGLAIRRWPPR